MVKLSCARVCVCTKWSWNETTTNKQRECKAIRNWHRELSSSRCKFSHISKSIAVWMRCTTISDCVGLCFTFTLNLRISCASLKHVSKVSRWHCALADIVCFYLFVLDKVYFAHFPIDDNHDAVVVFVFSFLKSVEIHMYTLSVFVLSHIHSSGVRTRDCSVSFSALRIEAKIEKERKKAKHKHKTTQPLYQPPRIIRPTIAKIIISTIIDSTNINYVSTF